MRTEDKFPFGEIIAATRTESDFLAAIESDVDTIFDLAPDIMTVAPKLKMAHKSGKKLFIHIDLSKGLGRDESGMKYLKFLGRQQRKFMFFSISDLYFLYFQKKVCMIKYSLSIGI